MLVKKVDLPKFKIATETANQYNRKKVIQTSITYEPINITFHDDNLGVARQLWENYFSYYYADPTAAKSSANYLKNPHQPGTLLKTPYGLDNNSSVRFFSSITIYQMAKQKWNSYQLINPMISDWRHDTLDYAEGGGVMENAMTLMYEAVKYDSGEVSQGNPPGFATEHYDTLPSPIHIAGGGTATLFGGGGVIAGASSIFGDVAGYLSGAKTLSVANLISTAVTTNNTYKNSKTLTKAGVKGELAPALISSLGGIPNALFPVANRPDPTTKATLR
jgi:hypothetical protein